VKKEWIMLSGVAIVTLWIGLVLIRWYAPHLLGVPIDLQKVAVSKELSPFFDGVFRAADYQSTDFLIQDPYVVRAKPLFPAVVGAGPHDILGLRNLGVPNVVDIITIGDSQTYGNNAAMGKNWPSMLRLGVGGEEGNYSLYNIAIGAWGAVEYLELLS